MHEPLDALRLWELPHVGDRVAHRVLAHCRARGHGLATFFRLPPSVWRDDFALPAAAIQRLVEGSAAHAARCRFLLQRLDACGGQIWSLGEHLYPSRLASRLDAPPPWLAAVGASHVLDAPTVAVLNSRHIDERVVRASHAAVQAAIARGFSVVSGGMKASHRVSAVAARAAAAPRLIVLDRGLLATFGAAPDRDPFGFGPGRGAFDSGRCLVVSPFRLADHASPHNGPRRDALVAALADVILAVHARPGGVIERICLAALDRGQVVLSWYGENSGLIAAGAAPIDERDLESELAALGRDRL